MRFIEYLLGIAPDGGSGSCELLLFPAPMLAIAVWPLARQKATNPGRS